VSVGSAHWQTSANEKSFLYVVIADWHNTYVSTIYIYNVCLKLIIIVCYHYILYTLYRAAFVFFPRFSSFRKILQFYLSTVGYKYFFFCSNILKHWLDCVWILICGLDVIFVWQRCFFIKYSCWQSEKLNFKWVCPWSLFNWKTDVNLN